MKKITPSEMRYYLRLEPSTDAVSNALIQKIHSMEPHTAYALLAGYFAPLMKHSNFVSLANSAGEPSSSPKNSIIQFSDITSKNIGEITTKVDSIKNGLKKIEDCIQELGKNYQKIMDALGNNKLSAFEDWIIAGNGYEWQDWKRNKGWFGRFVVAREFIKDEIDKIRKQLDQLSKTPVENSFIKGLKKITDDIMTKIPEPSDRWDKKKSLYDGKKWIYPGRGYYGEWDLTWEGDDYSKKYPTTVFAKISNPLGLLEMTQDSKKLGDFLSVFNKGFERTDKFYQSKDIILLKMKMLDTESAYVYMILVLLPFLQNQASESLEEQGNTMKQVSKIFDKWNEIQSEINNMAKSVRNLEETGILKDGKLKISTIEDFWGSGKHWKIVVFEDPNKAFQKMFDVRDAIDKKIEEAKKLLQSVKGRLPSSSNKLIETIENLLKNLSVTSKDYNFYYYKGSTQVRFEVPASEIKLKDLKDYDTANQFILERTKQAFGFFIDSDQTKFKAYMDNIGQGITALTSISNMTQQQLQIDTQYYNSLLGFQKSAQDSLNKIVQTAINNLR